MKKLLILIPLVAATAICLSGCRQSTSVKYVDPDDRYSGWYKLPIRRDTIIPVFKINDTYYSVCRGIEIPFRKTPEGLEWALEPSSMAGTKIGVKESMPFIIIRDQQAEAITGETSETASQIGKPQFLTRIEKPSWLLSPADSPPRSNDDFIGFFKPAWFPYCGFEIRKDGRNYLATYLELDKSLKWEPQGKATQLTPITDTLGFRGYFLVDIENILTYNKALRRFELTKRGETPVVRMPLIRISQPSDMSTTTPSQLVPIGIPTWH